MYVDLHPLRTFQGRGVEFSSGHTGRGSKRLLRMPRQLQASRRAAGVLASTSSTSFSTASSIGKRYRGEGRAATRDLAVPKLSLLYRASVVCGGEIPMVSEALRIEACWGPLLEPSGALWAPVLEFRGEVCCYALGAFPPSLHTAPAVTRIYFNEFKSPPAA